MTRVDDAGYVWDGRQGSRHAWAHEVSREGPPMKGEIGETPITQRFTRPGLRAEFIVRRFIAVPAADGQPIADLEEILERRHLAH